MNDELKRQVHIGTIGHFDHNKTNLNEAILKYINEHSLPLEEETLLGPGISLKETPIIPIEKGISIKDKPIARKRVSHQRRKKC